MFDPRLRARLVRNRSAIAGASLILALVTFALAGPLVARHGPLTSDFTTGITAALTPVGPCRAFPLGADRLFRDVLARLAYAAQLSLAIAVGATGIATVLGAAIGIGAGWYQGVGVRVPWTAIATAAASIAALGMARPGLAGLILLAGAGSAVGFRVSGPRIDVDGWAMRLVDVMLAFPFLLLVMALGAALDRTTATTVLLTLGATGWLGMARVVRAKTLQVRSLEYVEAARALGQSTRRLLLRHVLPNVAGPLIVTATILVAQMMVADSVLSYLGVGISPPTPTLGRMLFEGQDDLVTAPWLVAAPGGAILLAVWAFNMLGEGLRDALDPTEP